MTTENAKENEEYETKNNDDKQQTKTLNTQITQVIRAKCKRDK